MSSAECSEGGGGTPGSSTELFQDLLKRLNECHNKAVHELQLKVNKLKNERCFDAQKLEEFYKKNQHLREQQKTLRESIRVLQTRLQSGPCDRCREAEKQTKETRAAPESLPLLHELRSERDVLKEENKKLSLQLEQLQGQIFQQTSSSDPEEGMIPDSPKQPSSFPVVNKMKRRREQKNVRYAEKLLSRALLDHQEREPATSCCHARPVLVPETCDMDVTCISECNTKISSRTVVAESCHTDMNDKQGPTKRRSRETEQDMSDAPCKSQDCSPNDDSWSMDPGAALSQYDTSILAHPQPKIQTESVDLDCTFVSHLAYGKETLDQTNAVTGLGQKANDSLANLFDTTGHEDYESCPQNETSDMRTGYELENKDQEEEQHEDMVQDEQEETQFTDEEKPVEDPTQSAKNMSVACVVVTRKKAERRKLNGHTCKECEIYYADLPEEERKKKLSSCSRHRFRYIPPSTPENFWDVGFPSTQTCIQRGYIKEDNQADPRLRRRRPYLATFSPKTET